nr:MULTISPECIES: sugar phosphate isomerase/epimerase [unclassified Enterococcus]
MFKLLPLNLGIRAHDLTSHSPRELVEKINQLGLSHIQFAPQKAFPKLLELDKMTLGTAAYFGRYFQKNDIDLSILGCYINISSENVQVRQQALATFKHQLSLCPAYQAKMIATETGSIAVGYTTRNFTEEAYQIARTSIIEMVETAEHFGVTVAIEAGINHPIHTYQLAKRLVEEVASPNLKLILDCANLIHKDNHEKQEYLVKQALETLDPYLAAIHLKDYQFENNQITMVPVGQGCLDFRPIIHYLKYTRPLLYATLEATPESVAVQAREQLQVLYQES